MLSPGCQVSLGVPGAPPPEAEPLGAQLLAGEGTPSLFPVHHERGQGLPRSASGGKWHSLDACPVEYPEGNHIQRGQSRCETPGSLPCPAGPLGARFEERDAHSA
jgi:hypothetical protein